MLVAQALNAAYIITGSIDGSKGTYSTDITIVNGKTGESIESIRKDCVGCGHYGQMIEFIRGVSQKVAGVAINSMEVQSKNVPASSHDLEKSKKHVAGNSALKIALPIIISVVLLSGIGFLVFVGF